MSKSNCQSPKVTDGVLRLPVPAAEAFASRDKAIPVGQGKQALSRIARFRGTCKTSRS